MSCARLSPTASSRPTRRCGDRGGRAGSRPTRSPSSRRRRSAERTVSCSTSHRLRSRWSRCSRSTRRRRDRSRFAARLTSRRRGTASAAAIRPRADQVPIDSSVVRSAQDAAGRLRVRSRGHRLRACRCRALRRRNDSPRLAPSLPTTIGIPPPPEVALAAAAARGRLGVPHLRPRRKPRAPGSGHDRGAQRLDAPRFPLDDRPALPGPSGLPCSHQSDRARRSGGASRRRSAVAGLPRRPDLTLSSTTSRRSARGARRRTSSSSA